MYIARMSTIRIALMTIVFVFLLAPLSLIAEDEEEGNTKLTTDFFVCSMMNGKSYIELDPQSRIMYLSGIEDGAVLLIAEMDSVKNEKQTARAALPALKRLTISGFKFSDIMEEVNRFYEQASNRRIPVVDAYRYVLKKFRGASPEELASTQSALRKQYNK